MFILTTSSVEEKKELMENGRVKQGTTKQKIKIPKQINHKMMNSCDLWSM